MQRRIAQPEHTTLADPEELEPLTAVARADAAHAAAEMLLDVLLEIEVPLGIARLTPVDQVDLEPCLEQSPHE